MNLPIYERYTKSNILWVGNYPSEWFITKVKYEAYVKARVGWHGLKSDDFTDEGPFLVTGSDFKSSRIQWADCYHCDLNRYEQDPYIQLRNGDLLITKDGTIGKVALVDGLKTNDKATLNSGVFVVRPLINNFSTRFYFWLLQSKVFTDFVDYNKTGSTIVHLYQDTFVNFSYASPQLKEQLQIAAFLDHETTKIDNLIAKQQQLIELLKEKRQAVISHAVTKGLNPHVPMKDSGVEWLGEVPEHWDVAKLSFKYEVLLGKMLDDKKITGKYLGRYLRNTDVQWDSINTEELPLMDFRPEERERFSIKKGDLVVCEGGEIGRSAIWNTDDPCFYQKALHRLRPLSNNNKTRFMFYVLYDAVKQGRFISGAGKATIAHLPAESFRQYKFGFPPLTEQVDIATTLDSYSQLFDKLEEKTVQQIALLQERRTALISAAVTGKIDVRDWVAPDTQDVEEPQEATA
jgi:type I restriction enzyme S subunit